jgi:hypothetical protein
MRQKSLRKEKNKIFCFPSNPISFLHWIVAGTNKFTSGTDLEIPLQTGLLALRPGASTIKLLLKVTFIKQIYIY